MFKKISITIIWVLFSLTLINPLQAAVPHLVRYQGYATDAQGVALDGQYNLTFRMYDAPTGGNKLWEELQYNVPIAKGNFSVLLGQVTALSLNFDKDYWISVQVNTDTEMTPRQRMTTVPLAIRAERMDGSENVSGVNFAKNSSFDSWSNGASAAPDIWALTGTGATIARNTVKKFGTYSASVTAAGADAVLTQTISNYQDYANAVVTLAVWVKTSTANSARIFISDGTPVYSSYHSGTGAWELLIVTKSLTASPASLSFGISVTAGKIAQADGVMFTKGLQTWAYNELIESPVGVERGAVLYFDNGWKKLPRGNDREVLKLMNGLPMWAEPYSLIFSFGQGQVSSATPSIPPSVMDQVWAWGGGTYGTVLKTKFKKVSGVSTVTFYGSLRAYGMGAAYLKVSIGGISAEVNTSSTSAQWLSNVIDVSTLVNGTVYDVDIQLKCSLGLYYPAQLYYIVAFGS